MKSESDVSPLSLQVRRVLQNPVALALLVTVVALAACAVWSPPTPDLAAQVARADLARQAGAVTWWTGWFGGLSLPTYSVYAPVLMAAVGVGVTGALGVLLGTWATARMSRHCLRPRAAAVTAGLAQVADLLAGRVTFALGLGLVLAALVVVTTRWALLAPVLAVAGFLASPLAGLFGGIALVGLVATVPARRTAAMITAASLVLAALTLAVLFPGTGTMPNGLNTMAVPLACCAVVVLTCTDRTVRAGALLTAVAALVLIVVPGAIGGNIARLVWVFAVPVVVGCARPPWRHVLVTALVVGCWSTTDLVHQVERGRDPSTTRAFYTPMLAHLKQARTASGPSAVGQRLEVLTTSSQWSAVYAGKDIALARGWERQADVADNPLFYQRGALTSASYRSWLDELAVGWVAVPHTQLDSSAHLEAGLIASGLPYLQQIWTSPSWTLYRVTASTPLVDGATTTAVDPTAITFETSGPRRVFVRTRWSPYFVVHPTSGRHVAGVRLSESGGWTSVTVPAAGEYRLTTDFDIGAVFATA